jgi:hypothetical protein
VLIVAGIAVGVVAIVLALTQIGGSSGSPGTATTAASTGATHAAKTTTTSHHKAPAKPSVPANAATIPVAVLNATETTGLAHRVSGELQRAGYAQALPLAGRPPVSGQTTVVQYAPGHQGEAEAVARSLSVGGAQPLEASVAALAGSAGVVVIVGADKSAAGT